MHPQHQLFLQLVRFCFIALAVFHDPLTVLVVNEVSYIAAGSLTFLLGDQFKFDLSLKVRDLTGSLKQSQTTPAVVLLHTVKHLAIRSLDFPVSVFAHESYPHF
jgi:hypothetical protein